MTSIHELWAALAASGGYGAAQRVDEAHPCDLYAALDSSGRRGLVLVTGSAPPLPPPFEAVEVSVSQRADGRWNMGIWLRADDLSSMFTQLCQDLVEASRGIVPLGAAGYMVTRLARWRRLLEAGSVELGLAEIRGLIGELIVLQRCFGLWPSTVVVQSWVGPRKAPQDFTLPSLRIEAKTVLPGATVTHISSVDQLDVADAALLLAVVTLASEPPDGSGISLAKVVASVRQYLLDEGAHAPALEFEERLADAGFFDLPAYERQLFRLEGVRFFAVRGEFPRIRRADLPRGVTNVTYTIELGRCTSFEVPLARDYHGN